MIEGFQPGDQHVFIGQNTYTLRLTLGALAEVSQQLGASGPVELSRAMKRLTPKRTCLVLAALLRPVHGHDLPHLTLQMLSAEMISKMAKIFESAFSVKQKSKNDGEKI